MPVLTNTDIAVQNNTTGQVDYLQFQGSQLVSSDAVTYASAGWNVVAQGFSMPSTYELVLQNQSTGVVGILTLNGTTVIASAMSTVSVPRIVGNGNFVEASAIPGQAGPILVSQLPNGELDMLAFNASAQLIRTDLIANTIGFAPAVGVGEGSGLSQPNNPLFAGIGQGQVGSSGGNDNVVLQLANGSLDTVGFSGDFAAGTLSASSSMLLPGSTGLGPVQAVNQEMTNIAGNPNIQGGTGTGGVPLEGVQFVSQLADGTFDSIYADSGYGDAAHEGTIYASTLLNLAMPGWHAVDAGDIARQIFPLS
jgi:hypothetical protein